MDEHGQQLRLTRQQLLRLYEHLYSAYGPQHWWPGKTRFEVMVGAILTQNTAWSNVEKAIVNLRRARCLNPQAMLHIPEQRLARHLTPSGYFNIKAKRLRNYCRWYVDVGTYRRLNRCETAALRRQLLEVNGIGPETADDILLYAFERPVFVIDAYTRRLLARLGWAGAGESYEALRAAFERALEPDVALYNEFHALIVRHAKEKCTSAAGCRHCVIEAL